MQIQVNKNFKNRSTDSISHESGTTVRESHKLLGFCLDKQNAAGEISAVPKPSPEPYRLLGPLWRQNKPTAMW